VGIDFLGVSSLGFKFFPFGLDTTANSQRKGVSNNYSGYSKTMRTKACVDMGNKQQLNAKSEMGHNVQQ